MKHRSSQSMRSPLQNQSMLLLTNEPVTMVEIFGSYSSSGLWVKPLHTCSFERTCLQVTETMVLVTSAGPSSTEYWLGPSQYGRLLFLAITVPFILAVPFVPTGTGTVLELFRSFHREPFRRKGPVKKRF